MTQANLGSPAANGDDWNAHWKNYASSTEVNPAQAFRRMLVLKGLALDGVPRPVRLLEIGSGQGDFSRELLTLYPDVEVCGVDLSQSGVDISRQKAPAATFFQQDLMQPLGIPPAYHDWATHAVCSEMLEHVDDPVRVLRHASAAMAPGCRLVITVPSGPMSAFDRHIGHRQHFTPDRLTALVRDAGLEPLAVDGAGFPFFNLYRLAVVARGKSLITDVASDDHRKLPLAGRLAIQLFSWLFAMNKTTGRHGWQLVAIARKPPR